MASYDFRAQRLFVDVPLREAEQVALGREQAHYVLNVLRLDEKSPILAFNGRDGEWLARLVRSGKRDAALLPERRTRDQTSPGDLHYLFAPLKQARLDYLVQKAVEMGASAIRPVLTRHTQVSRVNRERMLANVIEAAEQCGVLSVPDVLEEVRLDSLLEGWDASRLLVFCDEDAEVADPLEALRAAAPAPISLIVGPEGGFSAEERDRLLRLPHVLRLSLGPRILRADTAAVAALALVQAVRGDWKG
ncbi:16S rRNA (uracil(1498)-N(3))-methyltransferase [uncultured Alsobacter sp.]|uniref:16S rRNA (uracil(1498)-N(3))-methyltransferase n=1 Tax=uncultured Alsobacter sp. TaxID=1748258 RepID=UPI0025F04167|nr:16S rRNA (uracil(1498)-N(3))-methyltransferase [uncultured Alsobacter sp.]